jgi:uncharacterized membrane protein YeaQ/YmgE (transglycosylase-associated protein family)
LNFAVHERTSIVIGTIIVGLIVGAIAKMLMPGRDPGGCLITILLGVAGSFVGSWLGHMLGLYSYGESAGFLMSIVGAMVILWIYRQITKSRAG